MHYDKLNMTIFIKLALKNNYTQRVIYNANRLFLIKIIRAIESCEQLMIFLRRRNDKHN